MNFSVPFPDQFFVLSCDYGERYKERNGEGDTLSHSRENKVPSVPYQPMPWGSMNRMGMTASRYGLRRFGGRVLRGEMPPTWHRARQTMASTSSYVSTKRSNDT